MGDRIQEKLHRINYLTAEMNALYHQASLKLGLSDSEMMILYALYDSGGSCMLSEICGKSGISKQTVNSAIRKLEKEEIVYLEKSTGKFKKVFFTEHGKDYAEQTVARLFAAETEVFSDWKEEEIDGHIGYVEKYISSFKKQIETL